MRLSARVGTPLALTGLRRKPDGLPTPAQIESNVHHLIWDLAWYGVLTGTVINFMQVYVVRLGAPGLLVSAITFGPALISMLWQIPAAQLMNRTGHRMRWVLASGLAHRSVYFLVALLPWIFHQRIAELTVLLLVAQAFVFVLAATSFQSMMADAMPADRIGTMMSSRMAGFGVTSTLAALMAGPILNGLVFPLNYQVLFIAGFVASMFSQWHLTRLCVPDRSPVAVPRSNPLRELRRVLHDSYFAGFAPIVGMLQVAIGMVTPLMPLYWVRRLDATDVQISVIVTVYSGMMVIGSLAMRRVLRRIGRERALMAGALGYASYPFLVSFSDSIWWLVPWAALGGIFYAAISVALFDNLVSVTPEEDRTSYIAVYNVFVNAALFLGPLLAGLLARSSAGPALGLQVAAGFAFLAGLLFARWRSVAHAHVSAGQADAGVEAEASA